MGAPLIYLSEYSLPIFSFVFCDELTKLRIMHDIHLISYFVQREPTLIYKQMIFALHMDMKSWNGCELDYLLASNSQALPMKPEYGFTVDRSLFSQHFWA